MTTKPATRIIKRGNGHSYLLDGEKCPGVTTILGGGVPKPWLAPWTGRTIAEFVMDRIHVKDDQVVADELLAELRAFNERSTYPKKLGDTFSRVTYSEILKGVHYGERDAAANRGTQVHTLAEALSRGDQVDVPEELGGHVDSYLRFLDEWQPSNALLERVIVNRRWRYMGKLDIIADLPVSPVYDPATQLWHVTDEPSVALLDVKTNRKSPYPETGLQLAAYRNGEVMLTEDGLGEEPMPEVDWCGVVWVRADGYDVIPFRADAEMFRTFLYVKQIAEFFDEDNGGTVTTIKGDALPTPVLEVAS